MPFEIRKVYIDSAFKDELSNDNSKFTIALVPPITLPEGSKCSIADVAIPVTWYTVTANFNDKIYIRLDDGVGGITDKIITITAGNYSSASFVAQLIVQINAEFTSPAHTCIFNISTERIELTFTLFSVQIYTDLELQSALSPVWSGPAFTASNLNSANEILNNRISSTASGVNTMISYFLTLNTIRNIYISSTNMSSYDTYGPSGVERTIIKKSAVNTTYGNTIFDNSYNNNDRVNVSSLTLSHLNFELRDGNGRYINFNGGNVSFSVIFEEE